MIKVFYLINGLIVDGVWKAVMRHGFEFQDIGISPKILQDPRAYIFTSPRQAASTLILLMTAMPVVFPEIHTECVGL